MTIRPGPQSTPYSLISLLGVFVFLIVSAFNVGLANANEPARILSPVPGSNFSGSSADVEWARHSEPVQQWYFRAGYAPGSSDIAEARITDPDQTQFRLHGLPVDGKTQIYIELSYWLRGEWIRSMHQFTAAQADKGGREAQPVQPAQPAQPVQPPITSTQFGPTVGNGNGTCPGIPTSFRNSVYVNSANQLRDAVATARPGDAVIIRNGSYNWASEVKMSDTYSRGANQPLILDGNGSADAPIYIIPESLHGVRFTPTSVDWVLTGRHMVFAGFQFTTHGPFYVVNSDNRIACNRFEKTNSSYIKIENEDAYRTRIDNNDFNGATLNAIIVLRCNPASSSCTRNSTGTHIHNNTFRNKSYSGENGHEAIILGLGYSPLDGVKTYNSDGENLDAVIENNLFDSWNGEGELISIKSSRNIIRNNCIVNSPKATIVIRGGSDNLVTGNWIENGGGGIRIAGRRNTVVFNYQRRASNNYFAFRFHSGESWRLDDRKYLYAYKDASNNVVANNVVSNMKFLVDTPGWSGNVPTRLPEGNRIYGNDVYSDDYFGTSTSGGYYNSGHYSESEFRRKNNWGSNEIKGFPLPASSCGTSGLFDGPGGRSATFQGQSNLLGGSQLIKAPAWW